MPFPPNGTPELVTSIAVHDSILYRLYLRLQFCGSKITLNEKVVLKRLENEISPILHNSNLIEHKVEVLKAGYKTINHQRYEILGYTRDRRFATLIKFEADNLVSYFISSILRGTGNE